MRKRDRGKKNKVEKISMMRITSSLGVFKNGRFADKIRARRGKTKDGNLAVYETRQAGS